MFLRAVRTQIPQHEPLLGSIKHSRIHEGESARLTRQDESTEEIQFEVTGAEIKVTREQMRRVTIDQLLEHVSSVADRLAAQQSQLMFKRLSEAAEQVGNSVSAVEMGVKQGFLEMQRRLEVEFDPETLEPKNLILVIHPGQVAQFMAQAAEWDKDPEFVAEIEKIRQQQIEAWRAREDRRKLVD